MATIPAGGAVSIVSTARTRRGLVLGKFLPPHAGHQYLVEFARGWVDELAIVVGTLKREPIPGELRYRWMCELFPTARVIHLTDENPQDPSEHPDFWAIWKASLLRVLGRPPDLVFASEPYGARLSEVLGARFVPVDLGREALPVSGTKCREQPLANWEHLPRQVRPWFVRRVSVFGPESTGKSTLARRLSEVYGTCHVPEYARTWLEQSGQPPTPADLLSIQRGQIASEDALALAGNRLVVCDTDPLLTTVWSEALFGECPDALRAGARLRRYDLTLLTDVDVPWAPDPVRYLPHERASFLERCRRALGAADRSWVLLSGDWDERFAKARESIDAMLRLPAPFREVP